jgi:hypothetical protein
MSRIGDGRALAGAETVRAEIAGLLRRIADASSSGDTIKVLIGRAASRLRHPDLSEGVVKRLWYGEVPAIAAHLADHIRMVAEPRASAGFVIDIDGRIRASRVPGERPPISVSLDAERVTIELQANRVPFGGLGSLRNWLLTMMGDGRIFRVVDADRGAIMTARSSIGALDLIEDAMRASPERAAALVEDAAYIADEDGLRPLNGLALDAYGIGEDAAYDPAVFLARNADVVVFRPSRGRLEVLTRTRARPSRAFDHARAWLAAQTGTVRLRVWWTDGWLNEVVEGGPAAAARLAQLIRLQRPASGLPVYEGERLNLDQVPNAEMRPFLPLLGLAGQRFDKQAFGALLAQGLGERMWLTRIGDGTARFVFVPLGPDYYARNWCFHAVGRRVSDQPDTRYGAAVEQRFVDAVKDGTPHVERVRARIREHDDSGRPGETRHASYLRLVVPVESDGETLALSFSSLTRPPAAA